MTDLEVQPLDGGADRWREFMAEFAKECAPARFSLWRVRSGWIAAEFAGWGLTDGVDAFAMLNDQGKSLVKMSRAGLDRLAVRAGLDILWADEELDRA
ncbi:hypothetical protein Lfu02_19940 [Longispora fulva]|uniref:Uncharacterized protein n=1 Tax=Longispora fulva TaxID=619741 RepID=A0A8J7KM25_9ACTN|nr:hypothetical protein [Longispora fulva]MBG6139999.1 hypothetical protein [Longispora fulva]GIG57622.1 hypothetical protein Lfu02_19940 [Longispora fulva]